MTKWMENVTWQSWDCNGGVHLVLYLYRSSSAVSFYPPLPENNTLQCHFMRNSSICLA